MSRYLGPDAIKSVPENCGNIVTPLGTLAVVYVHLMVVLDKPAAGGSFSVGYRRVASGPRDPLRGVAAALLDALL